MPIRRWIDPVLSNMSSLIGVPPMARHFGKNNFANVAELYKAFEFGLDWMMASNAKAGQVGVAYLARAADGPAALRRFASSYLKNPRA